MSKLKVTLLIIVSVATFFLVFFPHLNFSNRLPFHIDEWHHIEQSLKLGNYGEYFQSLRTENASRFSGIEIGFHFFLFILSQFVNLVSVYEFLPGFWAALSALILFGIMFKKTDSNFALALLAVAFFASIKSNVNLTGLWFFTPLSFSIPLIYIYTYLFSEGFYREDRRLILGSLVFMILLLPIHSISVLFMIPVMFLYAIINYRFVLKNIPTFTAFLIIPVAGLLFYKFTLNIAWSEVATHLFDQLQFRYGWGIYEIKNSFTEVYSLIGYLLAFIGAGFLLYYRKTERFSFYLIWAIYAFCLISFYRLTGISFLSPYQRNLYYLALSLPPLSALGFYFITNIVAHYLDISLAPKIKSDQIVSFNLTKTQKEILKNICIFTLGVLVVGLAFFNYYKLPNDLKLYQVVDDKNYQTLLFLSKLPTGKVMATPLLASAVYPIAQKEPVAKLAFDENVEDIEKFFLMSDCAAKNQMIKEYNIRYIISPAPLDCPYDILYAENNIIYHVGDTP